LNEKQLPPKEAFYSKLNDSEISNENYKHVKKIWMHFDMKTMRDYHNLHLKTDVLLFCDMFENFREVCMEDYEPDPAWYHTSPSLAWDACLKESKVNLELLSDPDMLLMIKKGIGGGLSMFRTRYSCAKNKYVGSKYNPDEESKYIQYLDANNL